MSTFKNSDLQVLFVNENNLKIYEEILDLGNTEINFTLLLVIGNLIADSVFARNIIINSNLLEKILKLTDQHIPNEIINNITWLLANCLSEKPEPSLKFVEKCFNIFEKYIFFNHDDILKNCYWGVSRITDTSYQIMNRKILGSDILPKIFESKMFDIKILKIPIIRIIGNIYASDNLYNENAVRFIFFI